MYSTNSNLLLLLKKLLILCEDWLVCTNPSWQFFNLFYHLFLQVQNHYMEFPIFLQVQSHKEALSNKP